MIKSLTKEQEAKVAEYREEFLRIGLSTSPCDRAAAEAAVTDAYQYLKLKKPAFIWEESPRAAARKAATLLSESDKSKTFEEHLRAQSSMASYGSFEAYWASFYCFIAEQLDVKKDGLAGIVRRIVENCGFYLTFDSLVIMSERPAGIYFNQAKQLHRDLGPALEYKGGFGVYALNGVRVPARFVTTPANEINVTDIMKEKSVDIRRECLRKVGFDRVMRELQGKEIHSQEYSVVIDPALVPVVKRTSPDMLIERKGTLVSRYVLVELDFGDSIKARYLKMLNPSIGTVHVEGVDDSCQTVDDALRFRNREILEAIGAKGWVAPTVLT